MLEVSVMRLLTTHRQRSRPSKELSALGCADTPHSVMRCRNTVNVCVSRDVLIAFMVIPLVPQIEPRRQAHPGRVRRVGVSIGK